MPFQTCLRCAVVGLPFLLLSACDTSMTPDDGGLPTTPGETEICSDRGPAKALTPPSSPTAATDPATFAIEAELSSAMPTVGIVTWSVDQPISSAWIEFGRPDQGPEYVAPVDLDEEKLRTPLLGMKQGETYDFRIVATGCDGETYVSEDQTIESGFISNHLAGVSVRDVDPDALHQGFIVSCNGYGNAQNIDPSGGSSWAFILDKDGDYVWAADLAATPLDGCSRARMSHDGRHMWIGNTSIFESNGKLRRLSMDGLDFLDFDLPSRHHDFTVLPNGNILYFVQQSGMRVTEGDEGPDEVLELDVESGDSTSIYDQTKDFGDLIASVEGAHTNAITFIPELSAFSFSMLFSNTIALVSYPEGQLLGTFGGPQDEFGLSWNSQHGHQFLEDTLLVFNNWYTNGGSAMLEIPYDLEEKTSGTVEAYSPEDPSIGTIAFGDVQRLPNGNSLVTFSSNGVFHEVSPQRELLREISITAALGLAQKRTFLYGPPPHLEGWP